MLDQFLFCLHDREVQLKLFDIGPTLTIDQAIDSLHMRNVETFSRATNNWSIGPRNQVKVDVTEAEVRQSHNGSSKDRFTSQANRSHLRQV